MTPRFLFIPILLSSALANAVEVSFLNPTDVAAASPRVAQVQRFADQPCELSWRITATAGEEVQVTGKVFLLATSLAAPMSALDFEVKAQVPAGAAGTEVKHLFKPEDAAGERQYLVKWQAAGSIGSILIGISQRGILAGLQQVSTNGAPELAELTQALQKEGV